VKSMGGDTLPTAHLSPAGIPGDRCWTLKDETRGGIKGGKRFPALMGMQARLLAEPNAELLSPPTRIQLEDGTELLSSDTDINARLSDAVGAPVSLWPLLPADQLDHYLRQPADPDVDPEAALREVFARTADEPLPDLSAFPAELFTYESPPGTYFDAFPLLLMTTASLDSMRSAAPQSTFDWRRFRPNIVLDTEQSGFPENSWAGRQARLGNATLQFEMACPRCVMTTHGFADLAKDPQVMRALVQHNEGNLGVYASVVEPGTISVGDRLEW
ncbi:MAG: MOSC domain-containing protein, partial [Pseudomonadota bacterium]